jgi:hypothetical protein
MQTHTGTVEQIDGGDDLHGAKQGANHPAGARSIERRPLKNSHELRSNFQGKTFFNNQEIRILTPSTGINKMNSIRFRAILSRFSKKVI